jgi:type I restriction enzyme S subunit
MHGVFIAMASRAVGQSSINQGKLKSLIITLPPLSEQFTITTVLQTVQEAIQSRRDELELERECKAALVEYLFTYGLTSREDASQVPMQQTAFGPVPQHWNLKKCSEICQTISVGIVVRPASYYVSSGVPAFRSFNVREDRLYTNDLVFVSKEANENVLAKSKLHTGDYNGPSFLDRWIR